MTSIMIENQPERMQCMEVWGGNRAVQRSIETPGLCTWAYSKPYGQSESGGDVYYLSSCASGRITRMLLADVSGHGELVSTVAVKLRDLMRRNVNFVKQTRFVRAMNEQFSTLSENGEFATAVVSTFFAPTKTFTFCNAGHPTPLLYRASTSNWTELHSDTDSLETIGDTPLGVIEEADYSQQQIVLDEGDMVITFSDALIESEDGDGQQLGVSGILKLVSENQFEHPGQIIPTLIMRIGEFREVNLDQDDTTILLCRATGKATPIKNSLLAPLRLFGSVNDATELD
jgi:sigma-B regulation protein RsbU (phosphoserine phosphatase)